MVNIGEIGNQRVLVSIFGASDGSVRGHHSPEFVPGIEGTSCAGRRSCGGGGGGDGRRAADVRQTCRHARRLRRRRRLPACSNVQIAVELQQNILRGNLRPSKFPELSSPGAKPCDSYPIQYPFLFLLGSCKGG